MTDRLTDEELQEIRDHAEDMKEDGCMVPLKSSEVFTLLDEVERLRSELREQSIRAEIAENALQECSVGCSSPEQHRVELSQALEETDE